jgi:hypothetical protein
VLWLLYTSFVNIGQDWYSYGWEIQLLETGFLAMFLCPLLDPRPFPKRPPPVLIIWLFRWLTFRIMFGAGLIKLRGDSCWRDLTCLYYHYETQPIPNPLSRMFHFMPHWFQKFSTLWNHFIELVVPWFGFGPRLARHIAGVLLVSFQVILIVSGNLSFLNYLTIVPMLACFDDSLLSRLLPKALVERARRASENYSPTRTQEILALAFAIVVVALSIAPTLNLLSGQQMMNASFDRLHLVNTYGAFGSVGRERNEIIFEGSEDGVVWRAYEFPFKPGDPMRRPGSSRLINRDSTGRSGSRRCPRQISIRGPSTSSGNCCTTIPECSVCSRTIRSQTSRRVSFAHSFTATNSRRLEMLLARGGTAN